MISVIQASDVILSRAGANSLWECAVSAKPMILIPLEGSGTRGDQVDNAKFFERQNAAMVLCGKNATGENLLALLEKMTDRKIRGEFSANCKKICGGEKPALKIAKIMFGEIGK
jgi:UDP-N-acetylglucosamine--N-acetylmuramyl-(pentapeptide) pyrophosphoryl-undecaprenol N-acetylglucosamine transferase